MRSTVRHPRHVRSGRRHHVAQNFGATERQKRIPPSVRHESVKVRAVPRQTGAPPLASQTCSGENHKAGKWFVRGNEHFGGQHRALRKPADDQTIPLDAVMFFQPFDDARQGGFRRFEAGGNFIEALHRGGDVAAHQMHHELVHADVPPCSSPHARAHGHFEGCFREKPSRFTPDIDDPREVDEVITRCAKPMAKQNGGTIASTRTVDAPACVYPKFSDVFEIHAPHRNASDLDDATICCTAIVFR